MIEFIYAIVGIVWLTQYYTSCNDLTAKNVTLGMSASRGGGRDRAGEEPGYHRREAVSGRDRGFTHAGVQRQAQSCPGHQVRAPQ